MTRNLRCTLVSLAGLAIVAGTANAQLLGDKPLFGEGTLANPTGDNQFVAPVTSPYYNENSFITNDVRAWFVYHKFNADALGADTNATDYAVQVRIALMDRLQLVAYKDGYLDIDGSLATEGWNDLAAGLKYQFLHDDEDHLYAAAGAGYEFKTGESRALQNDSEVRVWGSIDKGFEKFHTGATLNYRVSTSGDNDDNGNSDILSWHLRADYRLTDKISPVVEINGYHIMSDSSTGVALNGADVLNLGATDAGATISAGLGVEFRVDDAISVRAAYEVPLTDDNQSLFGTRLTFSLVYAF